uniref:Steroid 5 alpha-reductase n=1 Tax=Colletotrichum fructicola (strain Nara gc5) TaxID=1213859 RepID=L2FIB5_COLFN
MALVEGWLPPTRENWQLLSTVWQISYPIIGSMQYLISWYGMGKTSVVSRLNIPGRVAWFLMEAPGFTTMLYIMFTLPGKMGVEDLPWQNKVLAGLFVLHYCYRAVLYPLIQPSMSPIHPALGAFGVAQFVAGIGLFYVGLVGNYFHDEELREIRRAEMRRQERIVKEQRAKGVEGKVSVDKHYRLPDALLFRYVLFPHYFLEWVEWFGWWMASGWGMPGRAFFVNEVTAMLPRARSGRGWYVERFGEEKVGKRWVIVPGVY